MFTKYLSFSMGGKFVYFNRGGETPPPGSHEKKEVSGKTPKPEEALKEPVKPKPLTDAEFEKHEKGLPKEKKIDNIIAIIPNYTDPQIGRDTKVILDSMLRSIRRHFDIRHDGRVAEDYGRLAAKEYANNHMMSEKQPGQPQHLNLTGEDLRSIANQQLRIDDRKKQEIFRNADSDDVTDYYNSRGSINSYLTSTYPETIALLPDHIIGRIQGFLIVTEQMLNNTFSSDSYGSPEITFREAADYTSALNRSIHDYLVQMHKIAKLEERWGREMIKDEEVPADMVKQTIDAKKTEAEGLLIPPDEYFAKKTPSTTPAK